MTESGRLEECDLFRNSDSCSMRGELYSTLPARFSTVLGLRIAIPQSTLESFGSYVCLNSDQAIFHDQVDELPPQKNVGFNLGFPLEAARKNSPMIFGTLDKSRR